MNVWSIMALLLQSWEPVVSDRFASRAEAVWSHNCFIFYFFFHHYFRKRKPSTLLRDLLEILCQYLACILLSVVYMVEKHEVAPQASSPYLSVRISPKHIHLVCAST